MADLSQLFAPQPTMQQRQGRLNPFALAGPQAAIFARNIAMREAMRQNLSPDSGDPFFQFVGNRLMELGDAEGAMAVSQRRQEMLAAQSAAEQQSFENNLDVAKFGLEQQRETRIIEENKKDFSLKERDQEIEEGRLEMERLRYESGKESAKLDNIIKRQEIAGGLIEHEISRTELAKDRLQLEQTMKELEGLGINWRPENEIDKKTVLALNRGALAMRVLGTDLRNTTPSDAVMILIDAMRAGGGTPWSDFWAQFKRRGGYKTLSSEDRRFLMHALSIADLDLRPVSGMALNAAEVAGSIARLISMPGDDAALRNEKLQARADVWKGLASTLPTEASGSFPKMEEAALLTDAELQAIIDGDNP